MSREETLLRQAIREAARMLGSRTSPAKKRSSRANGRLGGRPPLTRRVKKAQTQ